MPASDAAHPLRSVESAARLREGDASPALERASDLRPALVNGHVTPSRGRAHSARHCRLNLAFSVFSTKLQTQTAKVLQTQSRFFLSVRRSYRDRQLRKVLQTLSPAAVVLRIHSFAGRRRASTRLSTKLGISAGGRSASHCAGVSSAREACLLLRRGAREGLGRGSPASGGNSGQLRYGSVPEHARAPSCHLCLTS